MADDLAPAAQPDAVSASVQDHVSPEEWKARVDLAACYRLVDLYGMTDLVANHISARVPGEPGRFLINPYGLLYDEMTASCLIKVDLDGNVIFNPQPKYRINPAGFVIHSAVHGARHDVDCVIHTHTAAGMAVSVLPCGMLPITQTSMRFAHVGYHDYEGQALNLEERARLVADLGDNDLLILRNHGLLVAGASIPEAFNHIHRAELACRTQVMAMACGVGVVTPPAEVIEKTYQDYKPRGRHRFGLLDWPALLRKLDKIDPSFRT